MRRRVGLPAALALLAALAGPGPAGAQDRFAVSLTVGTLGFGDFQTQPVVARRLDADGQPTGATAALARTLGTTGGWLASGSVLAGLGESWAVRAGAGLGETTLAARYGGAESALLDETRGLSVPVETRARVRLWEGALRYRIPSGRQVRPYAELGLAGIRLSSEAGEVPLAGAEALVDGAGRVGILASLGADVPLRPWLAGRAAVSTRLFETPFAPVGAGTPLGVGDSIAVDFEAPRAGAFADAAIAATRLLRLEVGLSVRSPARRAVPPGSGSAGSRPGSRR